MKFKLNFNLETAQERTAYIKSQVDLSTLTKKELNLCSDYILYGKDPETNTSPVDRKEIYIKSKYNSYQRQEPLSLDELMESPSFDEQLLLNTTQYKKIKQVIDRDKLKNIDGMENLWRQIDSIEHLIRVNQGKEDDPDVPILNSKQLYQYKHLLISLRREQYILKDSCITELQATRHYGTFISNPVDYQLNYPVFPCGLYNKDFLCPKNSTLPFKSPNIEKEVAALEKARKPYINFLDKAHIYQLCLDYSELKEQSNRHPDSPIKELLKTLDFYIDKANLNKQQKLIVDCKKAGLSNKEIGAILNKELNLFHQENYISTIWNRTVGLIAAAANLSYDEWCCKDFEKAWKTCNCCGRPLLRDSRNFVKKAKAPDGLTNRCKLCDARKRRGENYGIKIDGVL